MAEATKAAIKKSVIAEAHCPFLGGVDAGFFGKKDMSEVVGHHSAPCRDV